MRTNCGKRYPVSKYRPYILLLIVLLVLTSRSVWSWGGQTWIPHEGLLVLLLLVVEFVLGFATGIAWSKKHG